MKQTKRVLFFIISIMLMAMASLTASAEGTTTVGFNVTYGQTEARKVLDLLNEYRTSGDAWYWNSSDTKKISCGVLSELTYDYDLEEVAMQRAVEAAYKFSHTRPNGTSYYTAYSEYSYVYVFFGENLASGQITAEEVFTDWLEENQSYSGQGHRRTMLNSEFTSVAIGHVVRNGVHYWAMELACSNNVSTKTAANNSKVRVTVEVPKSEATAVRSILKSTCKITSLTNSKIGITLKWDAIDNTEWYYIYRKIGSGSYELVYLSGNLNPTSWTDTEPQDFWDSGLKYTYKVVPYCKGYKGTGTAKSIYRVGNTSITSISSSSAGTVKLSWSVPDWLTSATYVIQYSTDKSFSSYKKVTVSNTTTTISGLQSGKTYYFRVRTVDKISGKSYKGAFSTKKKVNVK